MFMLKNLKILKYKQDICYLNKLEKILFYRRNVIAVIRKFLFSSWLEIYIFDSVCLIPFFLHEFTGKQQIVI